MDDLALKILKHLYSCSAPVDEKSLSSIFLCDISDSLDFLLDEGSVESNIEILGFDDFEWKTKLIFKISTSGKKYLREMEQAIQKKIQEDSDKR